LKLMANKRDPQDKSGGMSGEAARDDSEDAGELQPPPDWPEGVPFMPVEIYFTPEEDAALDTYWEEIGRETAARQEAARLQRNQRARERRRKVKGGEASL
jgi:hypothetical protein